MPDKCAIDRCTRKVCAQCLCCQQNICRDHFDKHHDLLKDEFNPLSDQFNSVSNRLRALPVKDVVAGSRQQLEQWRDECIQRINDIFDEKCNELKRRADEKVIKLKEDTKEMRKKMSELMEHQDANRQTIDSAKSTVRNIEQVLDIIENTAFKITTQPIALDQSLIDIEEVNEYHMKLLALESAYKNISRSEGSYASIASSDQFLLYHQKPDLCLLNKELKEVKRSAWKHEEFQCMCWSATLKQFVVINKQRIFLVNENLNAIKRVQVIQNRILYSCACSNTSLFVSIHDWGSQILEYKLLPEIEFVKEWTPPDTCRQDERINDISYNSGSIALVIKNPSNKTCRVELINPNTFHRTRQLQSEVQNIEKNTFALCSLADDGWLVIDRGNHQVLYITKDGAMQAKQEYNETIRCANMFGSDLLVITTNNEIHFHKF